MEYAPDLIDFSFALEVARVDAKHIARRLRHADESGADFTAALVSQIPHLRKLCTDLAELVRQAERVLA
jgi:hypothetical protein